MKITLDDLKSFLPNEIFAYGVIRITNVREPARYMKWVAVRGHRHDWAIYQVSGTSEEISEWDWERIRSWGDKIHSKSEALDLVNCTEEALQMYRDR